MARHSACARTECHPVFLSSLISSREQSGGRREWPIRMAAARSTGRPLFLQGGWFGLARYDCQEADGYFELSHAEHEELMAAIPELRLRIRHQVH